VDTKLKCVFEHPVNTSTTTKAETRTSKPEENSNDGKNKIIDDALKSSPKV
jgi:hypothetical protein